MHRIEVADAASRLRALVNEASDGEDVVLTDGDQPVARIVSIEKGSLARRGFGTWRGHIAMRDDFDEPIPGMNG